MSSAHVVSFVALFVALGSGAYAATVAPTDSVNSNSVKNETLLSQDVKNGTLRGIDVAPDALGGLKIKESTLSTVPHAANADNAINATNAANATHANSATSANNATNATNAANAANADKLQGNAASAFASAATFQRAAFVLTDNTNDSNAVTQDLVAAGPLHVIASCKNTGGNALEGQIYVTSTAAGWAIDTVGGPGGVDNQTSVLAGITHKQLIATFGPATGRQMATATYSVHLGVNRIDGVAGLELHPAGSNIACTFSNGAFVSTT